MVVVMGGGKAAVVAVEARNVLKANDALVAAVGTVTMAMAMTTTTMVKVGTGNN
jgi:hypothetical protein